MFSHLDLYPAGTARRRPRLGAGAATLVLISLLAACGPAPDAPDARPLSEPAAPEPVRIGLALQPASALAMVAEAEGMFAAQGLAVRVTDYPSGKRALMDGLLEGEVDVITTSAAVVARAGLDEVPLRVLAATFYADNVNRVVARRDAGIETPADLAGKRVGTQRASAVHYFWHLFSQERGVHDRVDLRFLPAAELPAALARGELDAFSMREPYVSEARTLLGDRALVFSAPGLYGQRDLLVADAAFADARPEVGRRLLAALLQAQEFCRAQPDRAQALVARRLSLPVASIVALWPEVQMRVVLDQSLLLLLEDQARWYMSAGLVPERRLPDFLSLIDPAPLDALAPSAVTLIR